MARVVVDEAHTLLVDIQPTFLPARCGLAADAELLTRWSWCKCSGCTCCLFAGRLLLGGGSQPGADRQRPGDARFLRIQRDSSTLRSCSCGTNTHPAGGERVRGHLRT